MTNYYLRVEAVNLGAFIYDTQDLSTERGGSLLLLAAIDRVKDKFLSKGDEIIMCGASIGLLSFQADGPDDAEKRRQDVETLLRDDEQLKHASFVVDIQPALVDFKHDSEALLARNRWRQMTMPSMAYPGEGKSVCKEDRVRPAAPNSTMSASVSVRREYGKTQKQGFYKGLLADDKLPNRFAQDLGAIAKNKTMGNLDGKLAVFYADGNGFSTLRDKVVKDATDLTKFANAISEKRMALVAKLFKTAVPSSKWKGSDGSGEYFRMETLLWGGDELIWVVPAWLGWDLARYFFRETRDWKLASGEPLTHAAGLVFCHQKAPISRITQLAKDLADMVKEKVKSADQTTNGIAYLALESFDNAGLDLDAFWDGYLPKDFNGSDWVLTLDTSRLEALERSSNEFSNEVKAKIAKSKVYEASRHIEMGARHGLALPPSLPELFGTDREGADLTVLHLSLLWDYVDEEFDWCQPENQENQA